MMTGKASDRRALRDLEAMDSFVGRHIGPSDADIAEMLDVVGLTSLDELTKKTVPPSILNPGGYDAPPLPEDRAMAKLADMAAKNRIARSMIGMGYADCITPPVILRNVLENPGWYTAYTPYQAEISQGRMEALMNYQQMVMDLSLIHI